MKTLLLIEDDESIAEVLVLLLSTRGYEVKHYYDFETLQQFSDAVNNLKPHLIISDVFLPHIDGRELCKYLKAKEGFKKVPYLLYSAGNLSEKEIQESCGDMFLRKPFDLPVFEQAIQSLASTNYN